MSVANSLSQKPENIGFDVRDDVKVFDFGLAREMKDRDRNKNPNDGTYILSGMTGSLPYMAPEVLLGQPYNDKSDMYSLSFLMWQIMELKMPFQGLNERQVHETAYNKQERPCLNQKWSRPIVSLIRNSWDRIISARPSAAEASEVIRVEVFVSGGEDLDESLDRTSRSDAHVSFPSK
jgi:serine/threonine protein kinase